MPGSAGEAAQDGAENRIGFAEQPAPKLKIESFTLHPYEEGGLQPTRDNAKKAKILNALYDLIGRGWIPHSSFIVLTGWPQEAYFGSSTETGWMQKQLIYLHSTLGVDIDFRKDLGVRFAEDVIRAH